MEIVAFIVGYVVLFAIIVGMATAMLSGKIPKIVGVAVSSAATTLAIGLPLADLLMR